jgi:hypothetical protein
MPIQGISCALVLTATSMNQTVNQRKLQHTKSTWVRQPDRLFPSLFVGKAFPAPAPHVPLSIYFLARPQENQESLSTGLNIIPKLSEFHGLSLKFQTLQYSETRFQMMAHDLGVYSIFLVMRISTSKRMIYLACIMSSMPSSPLY